MMISHNRLQCSTGVYCTLPFSTITVLCVRYLWLTHQWCQWLSICSYSISIKRVSIFYEMLLLYILFFVVICGDLTWRVMTSHDMTWHYCFICMTLSTASTTKHRHVTDSIYHYLPIHLQGGHRAFHVASQDGNVEIASLLLDRGADIDAKTNVSYILRIVHN